MLVKLLSSAVKSSSRMTCCMGYHKPAAPLRTQRYMKHVTWLERKIDRATAHEKLVYRSSTSVFFSFSKLLILFVPMYMYYRGAVTIYNYIMVEDTRHPSQIDHTEEVTLPMALCGVLISTVFGVGALILSRLLVRRVYYNESKEQFRLIISNLIGNRQKVVSFNSVVATNQLLVTHRLGNVRLHMPESGFSTGPYYQLLIAP